MNTLTVTSEYARIFLANMATKLTLSQIADMNNNQLAIHVQRLMFQFAMEQQVIKVEVTD